MTTWSIGCGRWGPQGRSSLAAPAAKGTLTNANNFGVFTSGGQETLTQTGNDTSALANTGSSSDTRTSSDSYSMYQAGSFALGSYAFASVSYYQGASASWSATATAMATATSLHTYNLVGTVTAADTLAAAGITFGSGNDQATVSANDTVLGTATSTSSDTVTDQGGDCWSLAEQGTFGGYSYSLSSVVYQGTVASAGTVQRASQDSFSGSATVVANGSSQGGASGSGLHTVNDLGTLTVFDFNQSGSSSTDAGAGTSSWYEGGAEADGSFAFASVTETFAAGDTSTQAGSSSNAETVTLSGVLTNTTGTGQSAGFVSNSYQDLVTNGVWATATFVFVTSQSGSFTRGASTSELQTQRGAFAAGTYAFGSYVWQSGDASTFTSQQTSSWGETLTASGSMTGSDAGAHTSAFGGGSMALVYAVEQNSSSQSSSFLGTATSADTVAGLESDALVESSYQDGSYAGDSYALSSVAYSLSSTALDSTTSSDSRTTNDTVAAYFSTTGSQIGPGVAQTYFAQRSRTYQGADALSSGDTYTTVDLNTLSLAEEGSASGGAYALSCFNYLLSAAGTLTVDTRYTQSSSASGTATVLQISGNTLNYFLTGGFSDSSSTTVSTHAVNGYRWSLSEQGTFADGSFALSAFALTDHRDGTGSATSSGSGVETSSGTDSVGGASGPYTGVDTATSGGQQSSTSSATLSEQDSYANGSFALTDVTYSGTGSDTFSGQDNETVTWSGSFAGSDSSSD